MSNGRILPRPSFLTGERRPVVYFVTSNPDKLTQASLIFAKSGLTLKSFQGAPEYYEDYGDEGSLLSSGIAEVTRRLGAGSIFFLEDTSVRIESLSSEYEDVPGVAIKDWFSIEAMRDLVDRLNASGDTRAATVRSDIALHLPGLSRPVYFFGETTGTLELSPPSFTRNERYPWLRPDNLNGWLVPDGANCRLGEMDFDASIQFDFRAIALVKLIDRLEEYAAALNLPAQAVARKIRYPFGQGQLPIAPAPLLLVLGHTCAGKTTFGEHAISKDPNLHHIEASHVMRTLSAAGEGLPGQSSFEMASKQMLRNGFDIVARRIEEIYSQQLHEGAIITGFRTLEEVAYIRRIAPWAKIVQIEASESTRYARFLSRSRPGDEVSMSGFRARDAEQEFFGLLSVADQISDVRIRNEERLSDFFAQINSVAGDSPTRPRGVLPPLSTESIARSQLFRVLRAMEEGGRPMSPVEIEHATAADGQVRRSSVRKVVGGYSRLVNRFGDGNSRQYQLSSAGRSYLELVRGRVDLIEFN